MASNIKDPRNYINRELSWLKFNERVLEEAEDTSHPLLERLKFLSIFSSNLDEFYMIRVAGLKEQTQLGIHDVPVDGLTPREQVQEITRITHELVCRQSRDLQEDVLPAMRKEGIRIRKIGTLNDKQQEFLEQYFKQQVFPILTPLAVDSAHPFPHLRNLGINMFVELREHYSRAGNKVAVVPIPPILPRFIQIPSRSELDFVLIEDVVEEYLEQLFPKMKIVNVSTFRITRNNDLDISEAEADDLLKLIEKELRKRRLGQVIRLEVHAEMPATIRDFLCRQLGLDNADVYDIDGYLDIAGFMFFLSLDLPELKDPAFTPALHQGITESDSIFEAIAKRDIILHHPFDSFSHVVELVQEAAKDPHVLAIKQTLYRTSGKSPIVQALKDAAANGKQVTALIELKARFDEETNIVWAKELERSGVNVVYGLLGLKTHCKICMIIRQEGGELRRYVHISTGNYNIRTSRIYTDLGIMTCKPEFGEDASELFNYLTGYSRQEEWRKLIIAPVNLRENLSRLIQQATRSHSSEMPSLIRMQMNSLVDPEMIMLLYKASQKGVRIDLIVRGICCLRPGVSGLSEHITVRSIVGRFLEHQRIFHFQFQGKDYVYLGSSDLMQRNLNRRVELVFPVEDTATQERVLSTLDIMLLDNVKARILQSDGTYVRINPREGEAQVNAQLFFLELAMEKQKFIDTIKS